MAEMIGAYSVLVGKPEGNTTLGRPRRGWENNIKMGLQKVGLNFDWINLAQNRNSWREVVNVIVHLRAP
jgi:hypothetical protein